jgi:hypothetical protein
MYVPAWLLLLWSGAGASCAAAITGSLLGARKGGLVLLPRARSDARAIVLSLTAGIIVYPLIYGLAFEATGRADVVTGLLLGLVHGVIVLAAYARNAQVRPALRAAVVHAVYGAMIAFLYVTP